jgi:Fic family protein
MNLKKLTGIKKELDRCRPFPKALVSNLDEWFRVELTYTSNAIEGNTLTRSETALVLEKGLTVGGKPLKDHLEAANHAAALDWIGALAAKKPKDITEDHILTIHRLILKGIDDSNAGFYRAVPVRIAGSTTILPNPVKVPRLMSEFMDWLRGDKKTHPVMLAAEAHYRLVTIHPFIDGNGRTARLLMNLILMQHGYPPAIIRKEDRLAYINALEKAQTGGPRDDYEKIMCKAAERSLKIWLKAVTGKGERETESGALLKIGKLAQAAGVPVSTIRHWTKEGLLETAEVTDSGYHLYDDAMIARAKEILKWQKQRLTLTEIAERLEGFMRDEEFP